MIHTYSLGRAARYYSERTALASVGTRSTIQELNNRVARIAASLSRHGFKVGDRLAILLPNEPDYIGLVYACAWLGVIRSSVKHTTLVRRNRSCPSRCKSTRPDSTLITAGSKSRAFVAASARQRTLGRSQRFLS
jgi:acyl-CoA synthetase (AMP-forming)/AMP-acid ligase II